MLLISPSLFEKRRSAIRGPLEPLYDSLRAELEPVLARDFLIPESKALLSRAGGRCESDGAVLDFDPASPHEHRCPRCGRIHRGDLHHRAWITFYQLWLAERALHGALFHALTGDDRCAAFAREVLRACADRYATYPNRDNVLGPTRLFFSTYLESIWLLQICVAADFLRQAGDTRTPDVVRDRVVEPSRALIAGFDEGMSNRQVWNNTALLASALLCDDHASADRAVHGASGLIAHLTSGLLSDGTWYEGENYHQFALRGLWYAATMLETRGETLPPDTRDRLARAFVAPYLTALPDFTMPSRKDSQYAVSLRQWRAVELAELGLARSPDMDHRLLAALACSYERGHPRRETGRAQSTADVERNTPSSALTRDDLGWRALLYAIPELPELADQPPRSALLEGQGLAVFRRDPAVYVAMEFGQSGGGHGHPDRLNVMLADGPVRWLDDLGTASYVDPSLRWFRSTLAHNAPLVNGRSQPLRDGVLRAYDEREGLGWIVGDFECDGVGFQRAVVVTPDYLIDELRWTAAQPEQVELPWHVDAHVNVELRPPSTDERSDGLVARLGQADIPAATTVLLNAHANDRALTIRLASDVDARLVLATAPGQPPSENRTFYIVRATATSGTFRAVVSWNPDVTDARVGMEAIEVTSKVERHVHRREPQAWFIDLYSAHDTAHSLVDLHGWRETKAVAEGPKPSVRSPTVVRRIGWPEQWLSEICAGRRGQLTTYELSERHYRRSEDLWQAAGSPRATIGIAADDSTLILFLHVRAANQRFAPSDAVNLFDNEHADTMGAGVQLYVRTPDNAAAWMLVPESRRRGAGSPVRVRPIAEWSSRENPKASWRETPEGYEMRIDVPLRSKPAGPEYPVDLDVIINDATMDRERRRGQLVMSGAQGEFVYLRGDRHDPGRLVPLVVIG